MHGVRLTRPSGAPALDRSEYPCTLSSRLRACRHCSRDLPPSCTVFMALDSPFCSQQCRTTYVFSHVEVVGGVAPKKRQLDSTLIDTAMTHQKQQAVEAP